MTIWVSLSSKVKKGEYARLWPFLETNLPNVRGFAGALGVSIFHDAESDSFLIFEEWLSREHHQRYISFISENGVMAELVAFLDGPPSVQYFEKLPI